MTRRPADLVEPETDSEGFLSRWSKRKTEAAQSEPDVDVAEVTDETPSEESAEPLLTDEDMPDIETINGDSDVSGFLSPGVSDALRKKALRKMFLSAAFNVRDGLDEYDDDFTSFEKLGDIVTADMKHQMEMEEARKKLAESLEAEQSVDDSDQAAEEVAVAEPEADTEQSESFSQDDAASDHVETGHIEQDSDGSEPEDEKNIG